MPLLKNSTSALSRDSLASEGVATLSSARTSMNSLSSFVRDHEDDYIAFGTCLWCRRKILKLVTHTAFDLMIGLFLVFQLALAVRETDLHALGGKTPRWIISSNYFLLGVYSLEIVLRAFALGTKYLSESCWNIFDVIVVGADLMFTFAADAVGQIPSVTVLRLFRLFRLTRMVRAVRVFRELHQLLHLMGGAMRTLASAFFFLSMVFTVLSLVCVEFIQPIVTEIASQGPYEGCERCPRAFESVIQSNLTWFQVVIMADGWGTYLTPIIERSPAAGVLFITVTVTVAFGLMNILMSLIVGKAEDARRKDHQLQLADKVQNFDAAKKKLMKICEELDIDGDGELTMEEVKSGLETHRKFREYLSVMDIDPSHLNILFEVLDDDRSGSVEYMEFVVNLHKMKEDDSHTLLVFIKHFCQDIRLKMTQEIGMIKEEMTKLDEIKASVSETLKLELSRHHARIRGITSSVGGDVDIDADRWPSEGNDNYSEGTQTPCSSVPEEDVGAFGWNTAGTWKACPGEATSCNTGTQTEESPPNGKACVYSGGTQEQHVAPITNAQSSLNSNIPPQEPSFALTTQAASSWQPLSCPICRQELMLRLEEGSLVAIGPQTKEKGTKLSTACPRLANHQPTKSSPSLFPEKKSGSTTRILQGSLAPFASNDCDGWGWHFRNAVHAI